jgi:hypothetical protein
MRILAALRASFTGLRAWELGYAGMLVSLLAGQGHSADDAEKQGQKPLAHTGCSYADTQLIPALDVSGKFVDQEQVLL